MSNIKILAIDDSKDILFAISAICELENWTTITTTQGERCKEFVLNNNPDLIIVDYHMPKMDGIEVVKQIRTINKITPIIVLTVEEKRKIANAFLEAGADDYALKPIKAVDLISRIKVHLKSKISNKSNYTNEYNKGISNNTLNRIVDFMKTQKDYLTINNISDATGLAYQTVHRYLSYLIEKEVIIANSQYGKQGRPKQKYKMI